MRQALIAAAFAATSRPHTRADAQPIRFRTCPLPPRRPGGGALALPKRRARDGRGRFVKLAAGR